MKRRSELRRAPDEKMEMFEGAYRENIGNVPVMASNICDNKVINIQVPEGKITIDADFINNLEVKEVDGRKCMVLPVDYVEVKSESGGNPNAINNWDINAKMGIYPIS